MSALALALLLAMGDTVRLEGERAFVQLMINEVRHDDVLVVLQEKDIWIDLAALRAAFPGVVTGTTASVDETTFLSLASLAPRITFRFDERELTLRLTAAADLFPRSDVVIQNPRPKDLIYTHERGAFLNYGITWHSSGTLDTYIEPNVTLGAASIMSDFSRNSTSGRIARGLSALTIDRPAALQRWTIGEAVTPAGVLGSGLVIGGVSFAREFSLDPYLQHFPAPTVTGAVMTPATVEIYVGNRLVGRETLEPGPFQISHMPLNAGAGDTHAVVRDAFGREQTFSEAYYLTTSLLTPGTQEYRYVAGVARSDFGTGSGSYGRPTFVAAHRVGLTGALTPGFRAEGDTNTIDGGPMLSARLGRLGEIEAAASASRTRSARGTAASLTYAFVKYPVTAAASVRVFSPGFSTLVTPPAGQTTSQFSALFGAPLARRATLSFQHSVDTLMDVEPGTVTTGRRTGFTTTVQAGRNFEILGTCVRVRRNGSDTIEASIGGTYLLGNRTSTNVSYGRAENQPSVTAEIQKSDPADEGFGYRLQAQDTSTAHGQAAYVGRYGRYEILQDVGHGRSGTSFSAAGGVVLIGGRVHPSRAIANSYALVRVPDTPNVRVYASNQEVGRTDAHGEVLVPNLLPYQANRLAVEDQDLPLDHAIETVTRNIAPPYHAGAVVTFAARRLQIVVGKLVAPIAFGDLVLSAAQGTWTSPVGTDGEIYFENLPQGDYTGTVTSTGGLCHLTLHVPASDAMMIDLGTIACTAAEDQP